MNFGLEIPNRRNRAGRGADIRKWISEWNKNPRPFIWTKTADEILETLAAYCERVIDSRH